MGLSLQAGLLIDAGPGAVPQDFSEGNYAAGSEFSTTATLTIRSLGYLDPYGTGLLGARQVGLWNYSTQALLASVTVTPSSSTVLSAQGTGVWYLEDIPDTVIGPGLYRIAGTVDPMADSLSGSKIGNGVVVSSGYVRTSYPNGGFAFPGESYGSEAIRATLSDTNVGGGGGQVPEPSSWAMVGLGIAGLATTVVRKRRA